MDPHNTENLEIENEGQQQEHEIEEEEPEGSQGQVIEEEDEVIDGAYQENGHEILALETEFRMTHDAEIARKLIEFYRDADDIPNLRRVRETFLEFNLLLEGNFVSSEMRIIFFKRGLVAMVTR